MLVWSSCSTVLTAPAHCSRKMVPVGTGKHDGGKRETETYSSRNEEEGVRRVSPLPTPPQRKSQKPHDPQLQIETQR